MSDNDNDFGTCVVLVPDPNDPATQGVEDPHVSLTYLGQDADALDLDEIAVAVAAAAEQVQPFTMAVSGAGYLGPDKARVLLLESEDLKDLRARVMGTGAIQDALVAGGVKQYPFYLPHMTLSYDGELPEVFPDSVSATALGLWVNGQKTSWELTGGALSPELDVVVPIRSAADLDLGIRCAAENPAGRWYVTKRAHALGLSHRLPVGWGAA